MPVDASAGPDPASPGEPPYPSLRAFADRFAVAGEERPGWVHDPGASALGSPGLRQRIEDVLDTVVAFERADWLQDGVRCGPNAMAHAWKPVAHAARTLGIAVPPAVIAGINARSQGTFGTDDRAFLYLSTYFFNPATEGERRFVAGRLCGHVAARHVTEGTLYALLVDQEGVRDLARKAVGPALEVVLAPLGLGIRLLLSRWHRAAEISADRAGLLCCGDLAAAGAALLRESLGTTPGVSLDEYLRQVREGGDSPGKWSEILSNQPFTHKRIQALALYAQSADYAARGHDVAGAPLSREELDRRTSALLGVS